MKILNLSQAELVGLVGRQLENLIPDRLPLDLRLVEAHVGEALQRLHVCVNHVRWWKQDEFNHLHSTQYCIFLYYLSNTIWKRSGDTNLPTRLFLLNKALNGIDCFYEIEMPDVFFIGHSVGIVLAKATYGRYLVLYQNSTVGKNHGVGPVLGERVVMYPNSAIIGECHVGSGTVVGQGTSIVSRSTPGDCLAFNGEGRELVFKPIVRNPIEDIFRV